MTPAVALTGLTKRYRGGQLALDQVSLDIPTGSITGLLGRNGAGKTTLLRIIAGQEVASAGRVRVFGAGPLENDQVLRRLTLVREDQVYPDIKVGQAVRAASWFYQDWCADLAGTLLDDFALPAGRSVKKLSRGMRSALGIVIGLASRSALTMLDEPYAGLDAVARQLFYDRLLADYVEHPRTILLSTHLIDEAAGLFERVVAMDRGRVLIDATTDDLRGVATRVSGPVLAVDAFTAGRTVWERRRLGSQASAVMVGPLGAPDDASGAAQLNLEPLTLQELMVRAADRPPLAQPAPGPAIRTTA
jgi:ABC-2 type transport system ATP-binding protein